MELFDTFSPPARKELDAEARELARHANFSRALRSFCDGLTNYSAEVRALNIGPVDTLRWALAALTIAFEATAPRQSTTANLIRLCGLGGLGGPAAVRGNIAALAARGLLTLTPDTVDRRVKHVRPTEMLNAIMRAGLTVRLSALGQVKALPAPAAIWAARPGILAQFMARNARAFAAGFTLTQDFPEVADMMGRQSGYPVLLELIARADADGSGGVRSIVAPSRAAHHFDISRTQVRKLLAHAAAEGWLTLDGTGGQVRIDPAMHARLRHWIALEFAWTWRLVAEASAAYHTVGQ